MRAGGHLIRRRDQLDLNIAHLRMTFDSVRPGALSVVVMIAVAAGGGNREGCRGVSPYDRLE